MREPQLQTLLDEEATLVVSGEETTLVAPRFDEEETLVARPVVPLEDDAHAPALERTAARPYRSTFAPRRPRMLALVLISVLVGGVLGGAGLYLYQRQSQDPSATTQPEADAAQAPAAPAAAEEQNTTPPSEPPPQQTEAPAAATQAVEPAPPARVEEAPAASSTREPESVPAAERRAATDDGGTPKRGKKGQRDEEIERRPAPRPGDNVARADEREARRVDSIFYRPRRAARRARRDDNDADRLRRIFEGTPE
jgi:hypothetical protein